MKTREEILQMVENEDVEFIRLQFTGYVSVPGFGFLCNPAMETAAGKSCKTFV